MKISKRRYEKKLAEVRCEAVGQGQVQGRTEVLDVACSYLGGGRSSMKDDRVAHNAILWAQAYIEGLRLLSYCYDESNVEDTNAFNHRFFDSRKIDISRGGWRS